MGSLFFLVSLLIAVVLSSVLGFRLGSPRTMLHARSRALSMATTSDFKNGLTFEIDGVPFKLMEFLHVKPGKGSAFVRSKIKNMMNGSVQVLSLLDTL